MKMEQEYRLKAKWGDTPLLLKVFRIKTTYEVRCNEITIFKSKSKRKCHEFVANTFQLA